MSFDPLGYPSSVSTYMSTYVELPGHHLRSTLDLLAASSTSEHVSSEVEDDLDPGLDFSGLRDLRAMRHFLFSCDYYLSNGSNDYSSDDEGYDLTRECFHTEHEEHSGGNQLGMPKDANAPASAPHAGEPREWHAVQSPLGTQSVHLEQLHELHAKLEEEQERLQQLRHVLEQETVGQAPDGGGGGTCQIV